ncbi:transglutaminase-like domain-containing protein [Fibrobacterota bacterium]
MNFFCAALAILFLDVACVSGAETKDTAAFPKRGPIETLQEFDRLMEEKNYAGAKSLCTGQAARIFDFMVLAREKMSPVLDTGRSIQEYQEEKHNSQWAYVRMRSKLIFKRPFMGLTEIASFTAIHLIRRKGEWLLAEFEELPSEKSPVTLRTGTVGHDRQSNNPFPVFPVSPAGPPKGTRVDSARIRINARLGNFIRNHLIQDDFQNIEKMINEHEAIVKVVRRFPDTTSLPLPSADSILLAETAYFSLKDTALQSAAAGITAQAATPERMAYKIYEWVAGNMDYRMGAVLFGTSSQVLENMTGDCSEAAVLTAAMLRAADIPARVAIGLVHIDSGVFIGHAWAEARLGTWTAVDPALRQYPAEALRIKIADLEGRQDMRTKATNTMLEIISNLELEILSVWQKDSKVPLLRFNKKPDSSLDLLDKLFGPDRK